MAGVSWQVRTFGDVTVARKLMKMASRAGDMSPAWPAVVEIAAQGYDLSYEKQGPAWADLKPLTKKTKKEAVGFVYPIRERTGRDRRTMTNPAHLRFRGTRHTVDIEAKGNTPAAFHQEGTAKMAARPLILSRYYKDQMAKAISDMLSEAYDNG